MRQKILRLALMDRWIDDYGELIVLRVAASSFVLASGEVLTDPVGKLVCTRGPAR